MPAIILLGDSVPDALTIVSALNKQKISIMSEARQLATKAKTQEGVEEVMVARADSIVKQFRSGKIKFSECQKAIIVQSLVGAMAGAEVANIDDGIRESVWNQAVGHMAQHLPVFLKDIRDSMERGDLKENAAEDFVEDFWDEDPDPYYDGYDLPDDIGTREPSKSTQDPPPIVLAGKPRRKGPRKAIASWAGVANRLIRFLANPSYGFFRLGEYHVQKKTGMTQMRRVAIMDDRTCPDCIWWDEVGWQRIGEIPLPGNACRCMDRCRCRVEYR